MGTRADFYVGRGSKAEWIGSISLDGYPEGIPPEILGSLSEVDFRARVSAFIAENRYGTKVDQGWPWPWDNSQTTDFSYAFDDGSVHASCFGHAWFDPNSSRDRDEEEDSPKVDFQDMRDRKRAAQAGSDRSGVMAFTTR